MSDDVRGIRIAKFLASAGLGPRRKCEELVVAGEVTVNGGQISEPGVRVHPETDEITCRGETVVAHQKQYMLLNKPPGYTCSAADSHADRLVTELFPLAAGRLFTVGRLDRDSEGLLICTNDGDFAQLIAHPRHEVPKRYRVWVAGNIHSSQLRSLERGILHRGDTLKALSVREVKKTREQTELEFVIAEGKKREIRRMCGKYGWRVRRLQRIQIGPVKLGRLPLGAWRPMTSREKHALLDFAGTRSQ